MDSEASYNVLWPNSMELIATDSWRLVDVTAAVLCTTKDGNVL